MTDVNRSLALLPALLIVAVSSIACGDDGSSSGDPFADRSPTAPAYMVASRVLTPNGRSFFVSVEPDLERREVDLSRSLELNGFSRAYAFDGSVFTMDSESLEVTRHEVPGNLVLEPRATLSMAGLGIRNFRPLFAFLDEDLAYYVDLDGFQVVVFDPSEMVLEGTFPIAEAEREGFDEEATDIERVGDRVFVTLAWTNFDELDLIPRVAVIVLDAAEGRFVDILEDDRCAAAGGAYVGGDGALYVIGDNDDGRYAVFGDRPLPPPCLLRVQDGATEFDPDFYVDLREVTGSPEVGHIAGLPDGTAITRGLGREIDIDAVEDIADLAFAEIWEWLVLDVDARQATPLDVPLSALPFPPFEVGGELYFQREDGDEGISTLYQVVDDRADESLTVTGEFLQLGRIR